MSQKMAVVFPGQGSQKVGMLQEIAQQYPSVKMTFECASAVLGYDLWHVVEHGPSEQLDQTHVTQPALLASSYALWQLVQHHELLTPLYLAGHSLGEYTALVCAGALSFEDAIQLVAARGQFMQEAVQPGVGMMAAIIGLADEQVYALCEEVASEANEIVSPANINSIGQIVVAGHTAAVLRVMALSKAAGAKLVTALPVSVPSHCALMTPAADRLKPMLDAISLQMPRIPVISNVHAEAYDSIESIRSGLVAQLVNPVRWVETVQFLRAQQVDKLIECGPGNVLTGLAKRIDKTLTLESLANMATLNQYCVTVSERNTHES